MVRVMASGVFDILHPGHIFFLEEAKKLGNELVVVVARDSTARKLKHQPIMNEDVRLKMVTALKPVDIAILGHEDDIFKTVEEIRPDIIVLGYDQNFDEKYIEEECKKRGLNVTVIRLPKYTESDLNGTRKIIGKIIAAYAFQKEMEKEEKGEAKK
ncbi:MAG: adenylyltransferase/cytidyltransferase family protein [Thermoplasmata archaeon]